ncbi:hypothetical protein KIN20_015104 [Parelaphostrongylus tenuis]|uniref:Uncharacterized protein n=1 Tax=Parelaphostrongylus tenuis TaxID=148309 RepID=A0AAD5MZT4_PARTN|nr:hypothetical protein KIN20_015104 [Parelaphostrongylus tenuis]
MDLRFKSEGFGDKVTEYYMEQGRCEQSWRHDPEYPDRIMSSFSFVPLAKFLIPWLKHITPHCLFISW